MRSVQLLRELHLHSLVQEDVHLRQEVLDRAEVAPVALMLIEHRYQRCSPEYFQRRCHHFEARCCSGRSLLCDHHWRRMLSIDYLPTRDWPDTFHTSHRRAIHWLQNLQRSL